MLRYCSSQLILNVNRKEDKKETKRRKSLLPSNDDTNIPLKIKKNLSVCDIISVYFLDVTFEPNIFDRQM